MTASRSSKKSPNYTPWLLLFLAINILVLDIIVVSKLFYGGTVLGTTTNDTCPTACIARINQATGKTVTSSAKEYYVPLGSGTNATDDWTDVAGASAYIDTSSYGKIKEARFEATVVTPAGSQRVWVRLFNATDKHPVWYSEVTTDTSGAQLLTSPTITLDKGNKLYQVQMKSQLKGLTNLNQSRVHITTQ